MRSNRELPRGGVVVTNARFAIAPPPGFELMVPREAVDEARVVSQALGRAEAGEEKVVADLLSALS